MRSDEIKANSMKYIDMHCDTLQIYLDKRNVEDLYNNNKYVSIPKLNKGQCLLQFFAIFMTKYDFYKDTSMPEFSDKDVITRLYKGFSKDMGKYSDNIGWIREYDDIIRNIDSGKISALLSLEDGRILGNDLENIKRVYDAGFRSIGLTWNFENEIGYSHSTDNTIMRMGLKRFGKDAVDYMQQLGMCVDVSHLSDGGFKDVADISKANRKPFIASHSNCRSLGCATRNLTDSMIKDIGNASGVIGINFYPAFLTHKETEYTECRVEDLIAHIIHLRDVGGIDVIGIGTDFDGCDGNFEIKDVSYMQMLFDGLKKQGFSESDIEKIGNKNVLRVLNSIL